MRIITYQDKEVVDILLSKGEYKITDRSKMRTFNSFNAFDNYNPFKEGYDYIFDRTKKHVDPIDYDESIISPIWGWYKFVQEEMDNDNKGKYAIELEIEESKVLLSDFDYYENVVSGGVLFITDGDDEKEEEIYQESKVKGKEVIYKLYDQMISPAQLKKANYIQATFWKLKKENVISIRYIEEK